MIHLIIFFSEHCHMEVWARNRSNVFRQYDAFTVSTSTMFSFLFALEQVLKGFRPNLPTEDGQPQKIPLASQQDWTERGWNITMNHVHPYHPHAIHMEVS